MEGTDPMQLLQSPEMMQKLLMDLQNPAFRDKAARNAAGKGIPPPDIEQLKMQFMGGGVPGMQQAAPQQAEVPGMQQAAPQQAGALVPPPGYFGR